MKTKLFTLLLAVAASIGTLLAESGQCGDMLYWNLSDGVLTITGWQGAVFGDGKIWDAKDATKYGSTYAAPWYNYRSSIYSIIVSEGITHIGDCAFLGCANAQTISLPTSITSIGHSAFKQCSSLTLITIPHGVSTIQYGTFAGCSNLSSIDIPNSITSIEDGMITGKIVTNEGAFSSCTSLSNIIIPTSITYIGEGAFYKCTNLTSCTIPNSVTHLGDYIFYGCSNLSSVTIGHGVSIIGVHAFNSSGITSITIPNNVTKISDHAFELCKNLKSVHIGNNVTIIGKESFTGCTSLTSLTVPASVVTIDENAFNNCNNLQSVHFSEGLKLIKSGGFMNCRSLRTAILPNSLDSLGWQCFNLCSPMDTILIGENLKGKNPSFPSAKVVIWNAINADIEGIPCQHLTIGERVETFPRSVYNNMTPDTILCYTTYPPAIYPTENAGTANAIANTVLHLTDTTFISIPCGTLDNYLGTTGWENYRKNMHERSEDGCTPTTTTTYIVTFRDWDGTVLKTQQVEKGLSATAPANPTREGYTFTGWDKDFSNVQSDLIVTAQYQKNETPTDPITVRLEASSVSSWSSVYLWAWTDNGSIFSSWPGEKINKDSEGWYSYTFAKDISNVSIIWNNGSGAQTKDITGVTESTCYSLNSTSGTQITASVVDCSTSIVYYMVTFKDWDGAVLKTEQVEKGKSATAPANPTREGYTFTGWDKDFNNVQSDLIVTAQYTQNIPQTTYYTVTFKDWDGTVLKTEQVEEGKSATAPVNPTREGYTFIGWDKDFSNVQSDLNVTAQYQKNETPAEAITVRLKASSTTGWSKVNLYYWADGIDSPAWPGTTLTRNSQDWYSYTFPTSVTSVNIIWNDGNNQTVDITNVTESTCYKLNSTSGKSITVSTINCEEDIVSVTNVSLNKKTLQIEKGGNYTLTATVLPANATNKAVTWASSNTSVATVSNTGKIIAKTAGVSTIYCETEDGHFKAECYIVVTDASQGCDYSFEPTTATTIQFEATDLSFSAFDGGTFVILEDASHVLYLMYYGSLVNGALPVGNHPVSSIEQNGNIIYSIGGDESYDYGSFMATNFTANGYSAAYYIIAGNVSAEANNSITAQLVSVNGSDIIATYRGTQDIEIVPIEDGATKLLRDGQILILRGDKTYTLTGQRVE